MNQIAKQKIMVIDDNVTNLNVARMVLEELYDVFLLTSGQKALSIFDRIMPNLILLDIEMPIMDGFDVIRELKQSPSPICDIPVIFVTAKDDNDSEFEGLSLGAVDYITKPFSFPLLLKRVQLHLALVHQKKELYNYSQNLEKMVHEKTHIISELQYAIVHVLSDIVERHDEPAEGNLHQKQKYLKVLVEALIADNVYTDELKDFDTKLFLYASQLHDIGKISISDSILLKNGKFTREEFGIMTTHTTLGENAILYAMDRFPEKKFLGIAAAFAGTHHEKWNGTGYPKGLSGTNIPIAGRMMALVDVYDALISIRPYKEAISHEKTLEIIRQERGAHFDPLITDTFIKISNEFKAIAEFHAHKTETLSQYISITGRTHEQ